MFVAIFIVLTIPSFTIAFFQSTRNQPLTLLLACFILSYFFLLGYSFSINWVFTYDRIWRYQITGIVLIIFILPFALAGLYVFILIVQLFFSRLKSKSLKIKDKFGKGSKNMVFIWTIGLAVRYYSTYLIAAEGVTITSVFVRIGSMITMAIAFLYNPDSFFFSNAELKSYFIFNAKSGKLIYSLGGLENDIRASGLFGTTQLQSEISGAYGLPHILTFIDRVVLIESQLCDDQLVAAVIIVDKNNPVFVSSLRFSLQYFIKNFYNYIKEDTNDQSKYNQFTSKLKEIFSYAYSPLETQENMKED
jgi:hypothetical protein